MCIIKIVITSPTSASWASTCIGLAVSRSKITVPYDSFSKKPTQLHIEQWVASSLQDS